MATSDEDDKDKDATEQSAPVEADKVDDAKEGADTDEDTSDDAGAHEEAAPPKGTTKGDKASRGETASAKPALAKPAVTPKAPPSAGLGKSVMLFIVVVGGISLLMLILGNEKGGGGPAAPKWNEGQTVEVDITLVSTDRQDLACASGTEIKGLHCAYESQTKKWSKPDAADDKKMLKPYSTTNGINFMAAGVWSEPTLAPDKLPQTRFAVKCKLAVAGKMPRADVRWHEGEGWNNVTDWYVGSVSDCKMGAIQN